MSIYNKQNPFVQMESQYKNGTQIKYRNAPKPFTNGVDELIRIASIIVSFMTPAQKAVAQSNDQHLSGYIDLNSDTGQVIGVTFRFDATTAYATIPPERYFQIEQKILTTVKFSLTTDGRSRNFVRTSFILPGRYIHEIE